jgi:DNA-directed RNA polymerase specialized sigma24 family protein
MASEDSVTHWLDQLKGGDRAAAKPLMDRYFRALVNKARAALGSAPRRVADEEDVALSAFDSFCRHAEQGHFPRLDDRDDLWRILLTLTVRKASRLKRAEAAAKRGGGKVRAETDLPSDDSGEGEAALAQVMGTEPPPALAAQMAEEYRRLLDKLGDDELRSIAVWQMEGCTVEEIATRLRRSERTVARKLVVIRDCWREENVAS